MVVNKRDRTVICTSFANGKCHDFRLFRQSNVHALDHIQINTDTGYQGIANIHKHSLLPKKKSKKQPLSMQDKQHNRVVSSQRVANEHAIGFIKRFKIISDRYRNRRKRFSLRFNLIAGICNFELSS